MENKITSKVKATIKVMDEVKELLGRYQKRLENYKKAQQLSIDSGHWIGAHDKKNGIRILETIIHDLEILINQ